MLEIQNHGPLIVATNYWDLPEAKSGMVLVSPNAGVFRVLWPESKAGDLVDLRAAKECAVSRGPWPQMRLVDAFEILFDDGTNSPYALHLSPESFVPIPARESAGKEWVLSVWTRQRPGKPHKALERPCWYRLVQKIPYLKPPQEP